MTNRPIAFEDQLPARPSAWVSGAGRSPVRRPAGRTGRPHRPGPGRRAGPQGPPAAGAPGGRLASAQYVVAHELRTPLTSLVVGSRTLLGDVNKARRREIVRNVAVEAQRLADAVEDLLVLASPEVPPVDPEPVSLQATVRAAIDRASPLAPELSVRTLIAADVHPVVADGGAIAHVVRNLVAAAIDAAGDGGLLEAVLFGAEAGGITLRLAGRPDARAKPGRRPSAPLRDGATRLLAARLGGTLQLITTRDTVRADLVLPVGDDPGGGGCRRGRQR